MRLSHYFLPVLKENPAEAQIVSHRFMLRAGMIRQLTSGIYNWLPLGLNVLRKVENIVREEMNRAGAIELLVPTMQPAELWQESDRYDGYGKEMLRIKDRHDRDMLFGPTAEEVLTDIFRGTIKSYKDLPKNLYQIQWKFRDEIRPRFGVMRGREFLMKDAYSFDLDEASAKESYENMFRAYLRTFKRMGLSAIPVKADTGPIGGDMSHEFQVLAETGESEVFYDAEFESLMEQDTVDVEKLRSLYAAADEMHDAEACGVPKDKLRSRRGIEVGHIFNFGQKYSKPMDAFVMDKDGKKAYPNMGSYGIGVSRLVGAIIEANHDDRGIIWPEAVAPFKAGIVNIKPGVEACDNACESLYRQLQDKGVDVLYDDTKDSAGKKFATMDLIGLPWQVAVGPRGLENGVVELKNRRTGEKQELSVEEALQVL
jgi:prolyl-tRNA synthetase